VTALRILSGGAAQGLVASLAPKFKERTGFDIEGEFGAVGAMADKLRKGTPADMVVLTAAIIAKLAEENRIVAASIADIGRVETAIAVRAGDPPVAIADASARRVARGRCDLCSRYSSVNRRHSCRKASATAGHCRRRSSPAQNLS
jgi:molybdate transport system substrate-binding protein